ncbi:hypothetical protein ACFC08_28125 [Streptomyces sp. NPDC056112]|uniref:hypothetical protein n=1 Tax=unclassified Streptomyces TaxID=2593676 RepID=UPI001CD69E02|nr:hypothetical protein [Streptomyces sp. CoT10]
MIPIKGRTKFAGVGVAAALMVMGSAFSAQATALDIAQAKAPYESGGKVYAEATLFGPNPVDTQLCVYLNAQHPYGPDVTIASACKKFDAGTVKASAPRPACGNYTTWAAALYKGKVIWQGSTGYRVFC